MNNVSQKKDKIPQARWNKIYEDIGEDYGSPLNQLERLAGLFKKHDVKRILDLGCGSGRHILFLAEQGFEVYGIDIAGEGIKLAEKMLTNKGLKADLKVGSIYKKLPYKNNFFDAVISLRTIYHAMIKDIKNAIKEIKRILKPNGLIFISVKTEGEGETPFDCKKIAPRTYVRLHGKEAGVTHYIYNQRLLRKDFEDFKIHELCEDEERKYLYLLGELIRKN